MRQPRGWTVDTDTVSLCICSPCSYRRLYWCFLQCFCLYLTSAVSHPTAVFRIIAISEHRRSSGVFCVCLVQVMFLCTFFPDFHHTCETSCLCTVKNLSSILMSPRFLRKFRITIYGLWGSCCYWEQFGNYFSTSWWKMDRQISIEFASQNQLVTLITVIWPKFKILNPRWWTGIVLKKYVYG